MPDPVPAPRSDAPPPGPAPGLALRVLPGLGLGFVSFHFTSFALVNLCLGFGLLAALVHFLPRGLPRAVRDTLRPALPYLAWIVLAQLLSPETGVGGKMDRTMAIRALLGLALGSLVQAARPDHWRSLAFVLAPAFILVGFGLPTFNGLQMELSRSAIRRELLGPNVFGGLLAFITVTWLPAMLAEKRPGGRAGPYLLAWAAGLASIGLTGSRSALLLLVVGSLAVALRSAGRAVPGKKLLLVAVALLALGFANRRFFLARANTSFTIGFRLFFWERALGLIQRAPVFGAGGHKIDRLGDKVYPHPPGERRYAKGELERTAPPWRFDLVGNPSEFHNDYLTLAVALGLPGLLCWLGLQVGLRRRIRAGAPPPGPDPADEDLFLTGIAAAQLGLFAYLCFNAGWTNREMGPFCAYYLGVAATLAGTRAPAAPET